MGYPVTIVPDDGVSPGCSVARDLDMNKTGEVIKAGPGKLYGWHFINSHATDTRYAKFYNKATAPTSADTPVLTIAIIALKSDTISFPHGISFSAGISWRAVTTAADNGNTDPTAGDVIGNAIYK